MVATPRVGTSALHASHVLGSKLDSIPFSPYHLLIILVLGLVGLVDAANIWLNSPDRKQYIGGVTFDPADRNSSPDVLNLWEGFEVEPRKGSWAKLQAHLLDDRHDHPPLSTA
jgi:hypothetical protein